MALPNELDVEVFFDVFNTYGVIFLCSVFLCAWVQRYTGVESRPTQLKRS